MIALLIEIKVHYLISQRFSAVSMSKPLYYLTCFTNSPKWVFENIYKGFLRKLSQLLACNICCFFLQVLSQLNVWGVVLYMIFTLTSIGALFDHK